MKRIALIAHTANSYGANRCLVDLARTLKHADHAPHIVIPEEGPVQALLDDADVPYSIVPIPLWASFPWELSEAFFKANVRNALLEGISGKKHPPIEQMRASTCIASRRKKHRSCLEQQCHDTHRSHGR